MAWRLVLRPVISFRRPTQRTVFTERFPNVVDNIFGRDCGRCRNDGVAVACFAQLVLCTLEKLEVNQISEVV